MKKFLGCIMLIVATCIVATIICYSNELFLPWQNVNNRHYMDKDTYDAEIQRIVKTPVKFKCRESILVIKDAISVSETGSEIFTDYLKWLTTTDFDTNVEYTYNFSHIQEVLERGRRSPQDAYISISTNGIKLIPEELGLDYDVDKVLENLSIMDPTALQTVKIEPLKPKVLAADLQEAYDQLKWLNDFKIQYECGVNLKGLDFVPYLNEGRFEYTNLPETMLPNMLEALNSHYDTTNNTAKFTTTDGDTIDVKYKTYGKYLDFGKEKEFIEESIQLHRSTSENRIPYLKGYDNIGDTYIEVSLDKQHLWYYVNGVLDSETDVVTGSASKHPTPRGLFYVSERINGKYLTGDGYRTWVNKWMRLTNSGVGLHDATWRSRFGGSIYKTNGSHGCVNLPKKFAYELYNKVQVGLPVFIY